MTGQARTVVVGTAGHIDHGKSALVRALTGIDPDRLKEERVRGITIDLGFAHLVQDDVTIAFVDVPGHERFVKNMLAGAGGIDAVLLVVAADESIKPQTREHFDICRLLGLDRGLVALTKVDTVDADVRELAELEVREFVAGSFLADAPVLPVSARTGEGLDGLRRALAGLAGGRPRQARTDVVRLPVDRVFSVKGFGTVVTGTLVSGRVGEGADVVLLPGGEPVRVRGVEVHGRPAATAVAPCRAALNLGAVEVASIERGVTVATPGALAATRHVDVRLSLVPGARALEHGSRVRVHQGTAERLGRVSLGAVLQGGDWIAAGAGQRGVAVPPGGEAFARLRLERAAALTRGDRLVLRAYSPPVTIGGAVVLDPEPRPGGVRRADSLDRFRRLEETPATAALWLGEAAGRGIAPADLVRRGGLGPGEADRVIDGLVSSGAARRAGIQVVATDVVDRLAAGIERVVSAFHRRYPVETGMPRDAVRQQTAAAARPEVFDLAAGDLAAQGRVAGTDRLHDPAHRSASAGALGPTADAVRAELATAGLRPPDEAALAAAVGLSAGELRPILAVLAREGRLVRLEAFVFHPDVLEKLKQEVRTLAPGGGKAAELDVGAFKARYGLSRKYAIPLLEWLDRERVTRRDGSRRVILPI